MDSGMQNALVSELQSYVRGTALLGKDLADKAPLFNRELMRCASLLGATTSAGTLGAVISRIRRDNALEFLSETDLAHKATGRDWAAVLEMLFNTKKLDDEIMTRRSNFQLPKRIAESYSISSNKSSKLRSVVEPDAIRVLVMRVASLSTPSRPVDSMMSQMDPVSQIRGTIRKLVATHGLNDPQWTKAVSSQYFVCLLARRMDMTHRDDYKLLLNRFLESFTYRSDDTIDLNPQHVLVTPEELASMKQQMEHEDPFFKNSDKTRAERIDMDALHLNYLYGLTLGITADGKSKIFRTLRDVAISHLADRDSTGRVIDLDGGWIPYRIPWLTARNLISFAQLSKDEIATEGCEELIRSALASLLDRLTDDLTWRSGVGDWVSKWESTGLCLEALFSFWEYVDNPEAVILVAEYCCDQFSSWAVTPDFSSDSVSNETLAAVILASVLLLASENGRFELSRDLKSEMQGLVAQSLRLASDTLPPATRQFCTIPQIAYYATYLLGQAADS